LRKPPRDFLISNGSNLADALISRNLRQHDSRGARLVAGAQTATLALDEVERLVLD
jgi:hypothetical protein